MCAWTKRDSRRPGRVCLGVTSRVAIGFRNAGEFTARAIRLQTAGAEAIVRLHGQGNVITKRCADWPADRREKNTTSIDALPALDDGDC